eukprot:PhM_4_TR17413/c0_g1_i1/m.82358
MFKTNDANKNFLLGHFLEAVNCSQQLSNLSRQVCVLLRVRNLNLGGHAFCVAGSGHFGCNSGELFLGHVEFLLETLLLLGGVNQTLQKHAHRHFLRHDGEPTTGGDLALFANLTDRAAHGQSGNDVLAVLGEESGRRGIAENPHIRFHLVRELVTSLHRAQRVNHVQQQLHVCFNGVVAEPFRLWVTREHDGARLKVTRVREAVPQLFGDEWHHRVKGAQSLLNHRVEHKASRNSLGVVLRQLHRWLRKFEEHITEIVQPEGVGSGSRLSKVVLTFGEASVAVGHALVQTAQDPPAVEGKLEVLHGLAGRRDVVSTKRVVQSVADHIPELVAELAVANDALNVQVDVIAARGVGEQTEAEGISTTLRDALGEGLLLELLRLANLLGVKVACLQLLVQLLELDAVEYIDGVDDVTLSLAHLLAILVAHHRVHVYLRERELVQQLEGGHHHAGHPEEHNVVTSLEQMCGEVALHVGGLGVGPPHDFEGPEGAREPGVQHILVLLQLKLCPLLRRQVELLDCLFASLLHRTSDSPAGMFVLDHGLAGKSAEVGRDAMAPPQLTRHAPRLDVLQPVVPNLLVGLGQELEVTVADSVHRPLCHTGAVNEPLREKEGLNNVTCAGADTKTHCVAFLTAEETLLIKCLHDSAAAVVTVHVEEFTVGGDAALAVHNRHKRELVASTALEIIGVMGGRHLHGA